jgi:molecular chaperone DnaJ
MPGARRDFYEVLGVPRNADAKAIKDSFRKLALQYHPDRNKEPDAEERFKEIAEAYAVLNDPKKRAAYDARGFAGVAGVSPEDLFGGIDFRDLFGGLGFDFEPGAGEPFDSLFRRRRRGPPRGANLEVDLEIPLERVRSGGQETVRIRRPQRCPTCKGSGAKAGTEPRDCAACSGTGRHVETSREGSVRMQQITSCPQCTGRGRVIDTPCAECVWGEVVREESLRVRIPVGVEEGMVLRIPGKGLPSPEADGVTGDLYVAVRTERDARFVRRGADLWSEATLELPDAVLGTHLEVPTLDGTLTARVPPGTQSDTVLRLADQGLPQFGGGARGHLYLQLHLRVPEHPTREERTLYERLRSIGPKRES